MTKTLKVILSFIVLSISINCWAKQTVASIAVNYNTGAYAFDKDRGLEHTAIDAVRKCEKVSKQLNKMNGWKYNVSERRCEVIAQTMYLFSK